MAPKRTCGPWRRVSRTVDSLIRGYSYCYHHHHHHHHLPRYRQSTQRHLRCRPLSLLYRVSRYLYLYLSLSRGCSRQYTLTTRSESVRAHTRKDVNRRRNFPSWSSCALTCFVLARSQHRAPHVPQLVMRHVECAARTQLSQLTLTSESSWLSCLRFSRRERYGQRARIVDRHNE